MINMEWLMEVGNKCLADPGEITRFAKLVKKNSIKRRKSTFDPI